MTAFKKYLVDATYVEIPDGLIRLDERRALRRAHKLEKVEDGVYNILSAVGFKRGEVIEIDTEPSKILLGALIDLDKEAAKAKKEKNTGTDSSDDAGDENPVKKPAGKSKK